MTFTVFFSTTILGILLVREAVAMSLPMVTPRPEINVLVGSPSEPGELLRRITTEMSTCGYKDGNPSSIRTANSGYDCRFDVVNGLWGFCPTTVIAATDCGLAGYCVDNYQCSGGCGSLSGQDDITTFTCTGTDSPYCYTDLMTVGVDQTYAYIACGATATIQHFEVNPTETSSSSSTTGTSSSSSTSASSSPSSSATEAATSTTSSTSTASSSAGKASGTSSSQTHTGAIVGGIVGGLPVVCAFIVALVYIVRRNKLAPRKEQEQDPSGTPPQQSLQTGHEDQKPYKKTINDRDSRVLSSGPSLISELASSQVSELPTHGGSWQEPAELPTDSHRVSRN